MYFFSINYTKRIIMEKTQEQVNADYKAENALISKVLDQSEQIANSLSIYIGETYQKSSLSDYEKIMSAVLTENNTLL